MNLKDIVIRLEAAEIQRILAIEMDSDREQRSRAERPHSIIQRP